VIEHWQIAPLVNVKLNVSGTPIWMFVRFKLSVLSDLVQFEARDFTLAVPPPLEPPLPAQPTVKRLTSIKILYTGNLQGLVKLDTFNYCKG
jgi:hypothetical protein